MSIKFVAGTRTGIEEFKNKTTDYFAFVDELQYAVPYEDSRLKKQLLRLSITLTDTLETLQDYE